MHKKMNNFRFSFLCFIAAVYCSVAPVALLAAPGVTVTTAPSPAPTDAEEALFAVSKKNALDLAGALINDGFRNRDGVWNLSLTPGKMNLLEVTLFAGNQYWFVAAATPPAQTLKITCYDSEGHPVVLDSWKDNHAVPGARKAAGFLAAKSGNYFIGLTLVDSDHNQSADASFIYAYK